MSQALSVPPIAPGRQLDLSGIVMPDFSNVEPVHPYTEPFRSLITLMDHGVVTADQAARHAVAALISALADPNNDRYELAHSIEALRTVLARCQGITGEGNSE